MRPFRIYIVLFVVVMLGYVLYSMISEPKIHWMITLEAKDKNPFGAYVLNERLPDIFPKGVESSYKTLSQIGDRSNIFLLANQMEIKGADLSKMFEILSDGGNILIAANDFNSELLDTLNLESVHSFKLMSAALLESHHDTLEIGLKKYRYPYEILDNHLIVSDSSKWQIVAQTVQGPAAVSRKFDSGQLTVINTPLIFTNFGLLYEENYGAAASLLNFLPDENLHYSQFYQLGKQEAITPLRFFLRQSSLRWALYLSLFTIGVLLVIDSWRKQRFIPVVKPPENTSVLYVRTLGGLYYREGNHRKVAQRMISHFLLSVKEKYYLDPEFTEKYYVKISGKMGKEKKKVKATFDQIQLMRNVSRVEEKDLLKLSKKIDELT